MLPLSTVGASIVNRWGGRIWESFSDGLEHGPQFGAKHEFVECWQDFVLAGVVAAYLLFCEECKGPRSL